jgi:hypothetical protein
MFSLLFHRCACPDRIGRNDAITTKRAREKQLDQGIDNTLVSADQNHALAVAYDVQCRFTADIPVMAGDFNHSTCCFFSGSIHSRYDTNSAGTGPSIIEFSSKFGAQIWSGQGGGHEATGRWYWQYLSIGAFARANSAPQDR